MDNLCFTEWSKVRFQSVIFIVKKYKNWKTNRFATIEKKENTLTLTCYLYYLLLIDYK